MIFESLDLLRIGFDEMTIYLVPSPPLCISAGISLAFPSIVPGHVVLLYKLIVERKKKKKEDTLTVQIVAMDVINANKNLISEEVSRVCPELVSAT